MKKSLLFMTLATAAFAVNAQETYNFFDPADCDADGWLWLDTAEKIEKYVGDLNSGKKILLVPADYEIEDPEFPGEYLPLESTASAETLGYNTEGVAGGEGSKTGGISLPPSVWGDWWDDMGGGIMVAMPDCAEFEIYMSQSEPNIYTELDAALTETSNPTDCKFIWFYGYDWWEDEFIPLSKDYVATDDLTDPRYEYTYGGTLDDPEEITYKVYGEKGCGGRTAYYINYGEDCDLLIQGLKIFTYTNTLSESSVGSLAANTPDSYKVYNLTGNLVKVVKSKSEVNDLPKGLYIVDGKKVIVK